MTISCLQNSTLNQHQQSSLSTDASESEWEAHNDVTSIGGKWSDNKVHYSTSGLEFLAS